MSSAVDHLVVVAATIEAGVAWCEATLGIAPGPGGRHPLMGTHNRLFSIASDAFPGAYFEIIAIDPEATPPARRRWFGMDGPAPHPPRLVHWVARTPALEAQRTALLAQGVDGGVPVAASRDTPHGRLAWQILVRDDGVLPCGGALPTLIQWQGMHPTDHMAASGVRLRSLRVGGLPAPVPPLLQTAGVDFVADTPPALRAVFDTPRGPVTLQTQEGA